MVVVVFFAQFCIILVNFAETCIFAICFAFGCIILLNFTLNFPKQHQKIAKWPGSTPKNGTKSPPKWPYFGPKMVPKWSQNGPIYGPRQGQKWVKKRSKKGEKRSKVAKTRSKVIQTFIKVDKNTQINSVHFQAHPLTAHFHRLKRRFWPVFKQNRCFIGKTRLVFAQFCTL